MGTGKNHSRGFTLIAALLIMVLLSGVAVGLLYLVNNEVSASGNGREDNQAYYGAEAGMEKLTADLAALYQTSQKPSTTQIQNLVNFPPTTAMVGPMSYSETITYATSGGNPVSNYNTISSGANTGMYALTIPMTLQVNATRPLGASVNMTRNIEVAEIPVFQFGVYCAYDCGYMPYDHFLFGGRVHVNGSLFLGAIGSTGAVEFGDKVTAVKQIILDKMEDNYDTSGFLTGPIYIPKATGGCNGAFPPSGSNCVSMRGVGHTTPTDESLTGGSPVSGGTPVSNWNNNISVARYNGFLRNSTSGATPLRLNFVQNGCDAATTLPCTDPISIIRKPLAGESSSSTLAEARLYNKAQIRILIADTLADLHPERGATSLDSEDVQLDNSTGWGASSEYFGTITPGSNNWVQPYTATNSTTTAITTWTSFPLVGAFTTYTNTATNPTTGAWIRVEYLNSSNAWVGVTHEWLNFGFGRTPTTVPTTPKGGAGQNSVDPSAILIMQELRTTGLASTGSSSKGNWYPINFYDTREGEIRDVDQTTSQSCAVNGIMNAVELDVGNLGLWLNHSSTFTGSGGSVNSTVQNGYILYFSDHRGMLPSPNTSNGGATPAGINGESGLEDVVNSSATSGLPPSAGLEPATYYIYSPEDVDMNGQDDNWGTVNIGYGFNVNTRTATNKSYARISNCNTTGLANVVTGARHVLKLVDGGMDSSGNSYLPMPGFTIASENPVYVQGNYNSAASDPFWLNNASLTTPHSAASIIADSVTTLSNQWKDINSLNDPVPTGSNDITASNSTTERWTGNSNPTYYRMAVSAGNNIPFPKTSYGGWSLGTDGGLIDFLRLSENWSGTTFHYNGSLIVMWYSEYNTGTYKCCQDVYFPPASGNIRDFHFDSLFLNPNNLPPGTPMLQDVVNLSYHQNFTPQ